MTKKIYLITLYIIENNFHNQNSSQINILHVSKFFRNGAHEPEYQEFTWGKSVVFALSSLTLRGWSMTPSKMAAQIAFIT